MAPALRMALQRMGMGMGSRHFARRGFSQGSGKILSEEEKAAENIYIKKMEQEKLEKLARKGVNPEELKASSGSTHGGQSTSSEKVSTDSTKNVAVLAGVVAVVAGVWWYVKASSKTTEQHD